MPSTFSPSLRIELIAPGEQAGTWGTTTNRNLGTLVEAAVAGYATVNITNANQALTFAEGVADQSRNAMLEFTTSLSTAFSVYVPPVSKQYIIRNNSSQACTIFNSTVSGNTTAAGTGVTIPANQSFAVYSNGTNFRTLNTENVAGVVAIANGGTGASTAADARTNLGTLNDPGSNGLLARTSANTTTARSIAVSGTGLSVTNADGASGNPTVASNATSANTVSTIVARDASGDFSAGSITATLFSGPVRGNVQASNGTVTLTSSGVTSAVNNLTTTNAAVGGTVVLGTAGTDTNIGLLIAPKGTGGLTTRVSSGVRVEAASTQDSVVIAGRAGGTTSRAITLVPAALNANRTITLPDATGTLALTSSNITGNAATATLAASATALATARTINGVSFDGTANINVPALRGTNGLVTVDTLSATNAVNSLLISNGATGNAPGIFAVGADTNVSLNLSAKGNAVLNLIANGGYRLYDTDSSHYYQINTFNRTANYNINLPAGDVSLQAGTLVPTTGTGAAGTWSISVFGSSASITGTSTSAVPSSALATGTAATPNFLRGDRTWSRTTEFGSALTLTSSTTLTGIPSYASKITLLVSNLSLSGTENIIIQLGTASLFLTSFYAGVHSRITSSGAAGGQYDGNNGFEFHNNSSSVTFDGVITLTRSAHAAASGVRWYLTGQLANSASQTSFSTGSLLTGTNVISRLRFITFGTNTYTNGTIIPIYE